MAVVGRQAGGGGEWRQIITLPGRIISVIFNFCDREGGRRRGQVEEECM